jgi:hypothetical protein
VAVGDPPADPLAEAADVVVPGPAEVAGLLAELAGKLG